MSVSWMTFILWLCSDGRSHLRTYRLHSMADKIIRGSDDSNDDEDPVTKEDITWKSPSENSVPLTVHKSEIDSVHIS